MGLLNEEKRQKLYEVDARWPYKIGIRTVLNIICILSIICAVFTFSKKSNFNPKYFSQAKIVLFYVPCDAITIAWNTVNIIVLISRQRAFSLLTNMIFHFLLGVGFAIIGIYATVMTWIARTQLPVNPYGLSSVSGASVSLSTIQGQPITITADNLTACPAFPNCTMQETWVSHAMMRANISSIGCILFDVAFLFHAFLFFWHCNDLLFGLRGITARAHEKEAREQFRLESARQSTKSLLNPAHESSSSSSISPTVSPPSHRHRSSPVQTARSSVRFSDSRRASDATTIDSYLDPPSRSLATSVSLDSIRRPHSTASRPGHVGSSNANVSMTAPASASITTTTTTTNPTGATVSFAPEPSFAPTIPPRSRPALQKSHSANSLGGHSRRSSGRAPASHSVGPLIAPHGILRPSRSAAALTSSIGSGGSDGGGNAIGRDSMTGTNLGFAGGVGNAHRHVIRHGQRPRISAPTLRHHISFDAERSTYSMYTAPTELHQHNPMARDKVSHASKGNIHHHVKTRKTVREREALSLAIFESRNSAAASGSARPVSAESALFSMRKGSGDGGPRTADHRGEHGKIPLFSSSTGSAPRGALAPIVEPEAAMAAVMTVERFDFSRQPHPRYTYYRGLVSNEDEDVFLEANEMKEYQGSDSEGEEITALPPIDFHDIDM